MGPFIFNSMGLIINIILDIVFMKYMKMGVGGAALATVIAQIIACTGIFVYLLRKNSRFRKLKLFKLDSKMFYKKIVKLGMPN